MKRPRKRRVTPQFSQQTHERINKRKRARRRQAKRRLIVFAILCSILIVVAYTAPFFRISKIDIIGASDHTFTQLQTYADRLVGKNINWYATKKIEDTLETIPYVKQVIVTRHFPNRMKFNIKEDSAYSYIFHDNALIYVNSAGRVLEFTPWHTPVGAELLGITNAQTSPGLDFTTQDNIQLEEYKQIVDICAQYSITPTIINLADSNNIIVKLGNLDVVLGTIDGLNEKIILYNDIKAQIGDKVRGALDVSSGTKGYFHEYV
ncbi:MAG: FtsQ-type POTRA domain-containing protein [Clostridiales bacterium]|jgi:cell division protein FtsQ|nr:FtsQ-type POTRA domain-containing protein [Clostridiales bacterium]